MGDESDWLQRREEEPGAPPPSLSIARSYARLEALLAELPCPVSDERWHDEVLERAAAERRRRRARVWGGAALAVAAAVPVLVLVWLRPPPRDPAGMPWVLHRSAELEIAVLDGPRVRSGSAAAVGRRLSVTARSGEVGDLRVYLAGGAPVARCPGGPGCTSRPRDLTQTLELELEHPVPHHVIVVIGAAAALPDAPMEIYLEHALAAGVRVRHERVEVH